uniref:Uncharacterized protein n=1 Tax=Knipowitschia caucasica TaxID=637954 RepID=A0AAV2LEF3_KNICA
MQGPQSVDARREGMMAVEESLRELGSSRGSSHRAPHTGLLSSICCGWHRSERTTAVDESARPDVDRCGPEERALTFK